MRLHRFYVGDKVELSHDFWINDADLLHQWQKVFRLSAGAEVVLFDGKEHDRLYQFTKLEKGSAHLKHVTDLERSVPGKNTYLLWSLLKKDKNDWVLQKCTELGVSHFIPLLAERSEKTSLDLDRSRKIIIEAAEQCGRSDIPSLREPMLVETAIADYTEEMDLYVCQQKGEVAAGASDIGLLIGPEGGWSEKEKKLFSKIELPHLGLGAFTLRAETAAVAAIAKIM